MLPKALKSCPKSKKSPDLVTLAGNKNRMRTVRNVSCKLHTSFKNNMGQYESFLPTYICTYIRETIRWVETHLPNCRESLIHFVSRNEIGQSFFTYLGVVESAKWQGLLLLNVRSGSTLPSFRLKLLI